MFPIKRERSKETPLSSLLFNTVLNFSLEEDLKRWQEKEKGIRLSDKNLPDKYEICRRRTTLLHVAGKYVKFYVNLRSARKQWVWKSTQTRRKYSVTKTKWKQKKSQSTTSRSNFLAKGNSARYFGQKITFEEHEIEEMKKRLKAAWAAFHKYRQELTSKDYRLCHRLRLFSMAITPTLTYASGTLTLSQNMKEWSRTRNERCFASLYKQNENTNRKTKEK